MTRPTSCWPSSRRRPCSTARWKAKLGVAAIPEVQKEHWTRVKALNRRFAEGTDDQYDTLRPASDLRESLKDEIYKTIEVPLRWEGGRPADDVVLTAVIDAFSSAISTRLRADPRAPLRPAPAVVAGVVRTERVRIDLCASSPNLR